MAHIYDGAVGLTHVNGGRFVSADTEQNVFPDAESTFQPSPLADDVKHSQMLVPVLHSVTQDLYYHLSFIVF